MCALLPNVVVHIGTHYQSCSARWPKSAERLIYRRALRGEQARALFGEVETVFQADAEFTVDGDHRLVAETHSRPQKSLVSPNEIRPLMAVEADAVSSAVRQPRNLVVGAKAGVSYHFARSRVHRFASRADFGSCQCRILRFAFQVPDFLLARRRLTEHEGACDVGLVSLDRAAAVH